MRWNLAILIVAVIVIVIAAVDSTELTDDREELKDFIIIHTDDTHGRIGDNDGSLGLSTAKALADRYREQGYAVSPSMWVTSWAGPVTEWYKRKDVIELSEGRYGLM